MSVSSRCGTGWPCALLLIAAFLCTSNPHARAQSEATNSSPCDPRAAEPKASLGAPLLSPPQPPLDLEAIKQMIREELKAEKARQDEEDRNKKAQPPWLGISKDLKLSASVSDGFTAETADKAFRFHFGGRLEFDNAWFTQNNNLLIGSSSTTRLEDGTDFRRARLRADGLLWEWIEFVAEVNFANIQDVANVNNQTVPVGSVGLTNCYLTFCDLPVVGNVRVGHFKAPTGLDRYTSANYQYYMERSSLFDAFLDPDQYQSGLLLFNSYLDDRVTAATSFTRVNHGTLNSFGFDTQDGLYAVGLRLTGLPIYQDDGRVLMHLGFDYFHHALTGHTFAVGNRMPLRAGGGSDEIPDLLATGNFFTPNGVDVVDFEWAFVYGPFAMSAEYALARATDVFESFNGVNFAGPRGNVTYQAFYVESGYFLTPGDRRRYDKKTGTWDRTVPQENAFVNRGEDGRWCHGSGAVQLVARYTYLDLVSGSPPLTPTSGGARAGTEQDVTLGVNWYLNPQTIISLNYVWTHLDSVVAGASGNLQGLGIRFHVDF